jgi:HlyD family secretion protein
MITKVSAALDPERRAKFEAIMSEGRAASPQQGVPGRVYILDAAGQPKAVPVMLGPTDGAVTELLSGDVKEGTQVVIGGGPRPTTAAPAAGPAPRGPRLF